MPFPPTPSNTPSNTPTPSITPSLTPTYTPTNTSCPLEQFAGARFNDCEGSSLSGVTANIVTNFGTYVLSGSTDDAFRIGNCFPTFYPYLGAVYSVRFEVPSGYELCETTQGTYDRIDFFVQQYLGDYLGLGEAWSGITYHYLNDVLVYADSELVIQTNVGAVFECQTLLLPAGEGTIFQFDIKRSPTPTPTATPTNTPTMPVTMTPTPSITASNTPSSTPPVLCNTNWTVRNADCGFGSVNDIGINGSFMGTLSGPSTFPLTSTLYGTKSNPNGVICGTGNTIQANVTTNLPGSGNCAYMEIIINSVQQHILYFTTNPFPTISGVTIANGDTVEVRIGCIAGPCPS